MGAVYRARDTRLNRDVAIKILPDIFASDPERVARFTREAQTLASLNHPHIAQIHGLEESADIRALVMELVEGDDLSARIARGPMPLDETLAVARQIADALDAAHEAGIVHRDLKPANVRITPDGAVKVLDFGLAKPLETAIQPSGTNVITSPAMTMHGAILGTAAYMAPEQAKGRPVDRRADLWALGCVIYEMLTGRRAFTGDDITDTITSVLRDDPDWTALPSNTPASVRRLLRRCLAKDRSRRLQSAADARLEVDDVAATTDEAPVIAPGRRPWWHLGAAAGAGALATAAALTFVAASFTSRPAPQPARMALSLNVPYPLGVQNEVSISPDGRHLVTGGVGASGIWLHALDGSPSRHLADAAPGNVCWSPDGRQLLYPRMDWKFMRLDLGAQASVLFADAIPNGSAWGCAWSAQGVILNAGGSTIYRTTEVGGKWEPLPLNDEAGQAMVRLGPAFLPDQRRFLYFVLRESGGGSIRVGSLDSPETTLLLEDAVSNASYRDGHLLYQRGSDLVAQPLDLSTLRLSGQVRPVAPRVDPGVPVYPTRLSASNTGVIVHAAPKLGVEGILTWFDRTGRNLGTVPQANGAEYLNPSLSPDGKMLAANRIDPTTGNWDVWLVDLVSGRARPATTQPGIDSDPVWSPDGRQIAYVSSRREGKGIYSVDLSSGAEKQLHACRERCWRMMPSSWTPDGRFVLVSGGGGTIETVPAREGAGPLPPSFSGRVPVVSPDGGWVAYVDAEGGSNHVFVQRFPGSGPRIQVTHAPGGHPRWRADGRELFFNVAAREDSLVGNVMSVEVAPHGDTLRVSAPRPVFDNVAIYPLIDSRRHADFSPDGQRMLARQRRSGEEPPVRLIINWAEPLRQP